MTTPLDIRDAEAFLALPPEIRSLRANMEKLDDASLRCELIESYLQAILAAGALDAKMLNEQALTAFSGLLPEPAIRLSVDRAVMLSRQAPNYLERPKDDILGYLARIKTPGPVLEFGIPLLDQSFGRLRKGEILSITAAEGSGKTSLLLKAIERFSEAKSGTWLHFNQDMTDTAFTERRLAISAGIYPRQIPDEARANTERYRRAVGELREQEASVTFVHGPRSLNQMQAAILKHRPDFVSIDYLSATNEPGCKSDYELTRKAIQRIRQWRERWSIGIVVLNQMSRSAKLDMRNGGQGGHGVGGGSIEQAADAEIELVKDAGTDDPMQSRFIAVITKARYGRAGTQLELDFDTSCLRFRQFAWEVERESKKKPLFGARKGRWSE